MSDFTDNITAYLRRCKELRTKINEIRAIIFQQREYIASFSACQRAINEAISDWETSRDKYYDIQLSPVSLTSYFEGDCADKATGEILPTIAGMNKAASVAGNVAAAIPAQISVLQDYIKQLEEEVASLQAELDSLVI